MKVLEHGFPLRCFGVVLGALAVLASATVQAQARAGDHVRSPIDLLGGGSGVLETAPATNGSGGVFLDLTSDASANLLITQFDAPFGSVEGTPVAVEVYTREGSYAGFESAASGWTLTQTVAGSSLGTVAYAPLLLTSPIEILAGATRGIYLHSVTVGGGLRYSGTGAAPPQTLWSNAQLTLNGAHSRTGSVAFAGTLFTPRTFSGRVHYEYEPDLLFADGFDPL